MKAIVQSRYGPADVLEPTNVAKPQITDDEVLVHVRAASIGAWVSHLVAGDPFLMRLGFGLRKPRQKIRASDLAGEVVAIGANVSQFQPGDEVYGEADAAFAEFVAVSPKTLSPKPRNLTFEEAAAVPIAGQTALLALRDHGNVQQGQHVLIIGAAGGVGTFAVQIAKTLGAEVTGVCSAHALSLVKSLGADHVIDYAEREFTTEPTRYDVILQLAGTESIANLRQVLTGSGTLVLSSGEGGKWLGPMVRLVKAIALDRFVDHDLRTFVAKTQPQNLAYLTDLIEAGDIMPVIDQALPLDQMADAMYHFQQGHNRGKTVVTM